MGRRTRRMPAFSLWTALGLLGTACATHPLTGAREFRLISEAGEIERGERYYEEARRVRGGEFRADATVREYVTDVGRRVAAASSRPELPYEFTVIDRSEPEAWALPGGKIGISRGLLVQLRSEDELAAVLGHQIAHAAARHGTRVLERSALTRMAVTGAIIATAFVGVPAIPLIALLDPDSDSTEHLIERRRSVREEIEADRHGMECMQAAGYDPRAAVEMRSRWLQLPGEAGSRFREGLFAAHPPTRKRLAAARMTAYRLARAGPSAPPAPAERHEQAMAWLHAVQGAYDAYDAARAAYERGDHDLALAEAARAAEIAPAEPRFHAFLGDMLMEAERFEEALASYDVALRQDASDASAYLRRGLARRALFDFAGARDDFAMSQRLHPSRSVRRELRQLEGAGAEPDSDLTAGWSYMSFGPGPPARMPVSSPPPSWVDPDLLP
jgi:predicted Zn-dependent protease